MPVVDVTAAFVAALRDVAREHRIPDFDRVLRADAADSGSKDQLNLHRWSRRAERWSRSGRGSPCWRWTA